MTERCGNVTRLKAALPCGSQRDNTTHSHPRERNTAERRAENMVVITSTIVITSQRNTCEHVTFVPETLSVLKASQTTVQIQQNYRLWTCILIKNVLMMDLFLTNTQDELFL